MAEPAFSPVDRPERIRRRGTGKRGGGEVEVITSGVSLDESSDSSVAVEKGLPLCEQLGKEFDDTSFMQYISTSPSTPAEAHKEPNASANNLHPQKAMHGNFAHEFPSPIPVPYGVVPSYLVSNGSRLGATDRDPSKAHSTKHETKVTVPPQRSYPVPQQCSNGVPQECCNTKQLQPQLLLFAKRTGSEVGSTLVKHHVGAAKNEDGHVEGIGDAGGVEIPVAGAKSKNDLDVSAGGLALTQITSTFDQAGMTYVCVCVACVKVSVLFARALSLRHQY